MKEMMIEKKKQDLFVSHIKMMSYLFYPDRRTNIFYMLLTNFLQHSSQNTMTAEMASQVLLIDKEKVYTHHITQGYTFHGSYSINAMFS